MNDVWGPLGGGVLIGIAVSLMLFLNGRVTGISGIVSGIATAEKSDRGWRISFVLGLIFGGGVLYLLNPSFFAPMVTASLGQIVVAGVCVGFGTVLGNGCTSGHGICGITRLSPRSLVATIIFMATGALTVFLMSFIGGR